MIFFKDKCLLQCVFFYSFKRLLSKKILGSSGAKKSITANSYGVTLSGIYRPAKQSYRAGEDIEEEGRKEGGKEKKKEGEGKEERRRKRRRKERKEGIGDAQKCDQSMRQ